jgi:hypothetical protein
MRLLLAAAALVSLVSAAVFAGLKARALADAKLRLRETEQDIIEAKRVASAEPNAFRWSRDRMAKLPLKSVIIREAARSGFRIARMTQTERKDLGERQISLMGVEIPHRSLARMLAGCERTRGTYVRSIELGPSSRMERAYACAQVVLSQKTAGDEDSRP